MPTKQLKVFGAFRTGSNLIRSLLELNYDVVVHNNNYAYKHIPVPAEFKKNVYKPFPVGIISTVKDPFAFLDSAFRYCVKKNFLNIEAGKTFDEFCYQRFVVFDAGFKDFPRYRFANPVQYWNSIYHNLLSLPEKRNYILRYEDVLDDMQGKVAEIAKKYRLTRKPGKFKKPTGITINLGDPERSSPKDYFQDVAFDRNDYYVERQYMNRFTDAQKDFIYSELDLNVLQALDYPASSTVLDSQARKTSFVSDLRQLVSLGESRIPQLEDSLGKERDASTKLTSELQATRKKLHELETSSTDDQLAANSTILELRNNLKNEQAAREYDLDTFTEELDKSRQAMDSASQNIANLESQLSEANATLAAHQAQIEARDTQLEARARLLEAQDAQLEVREAELKVAIEQLETRDAQLEATNAHLEAREAQLEASKVQLEEINNRLENRNSQLEDRDTQIAQQSAQLKVLQHQLEERNSELETLNSHIKVRESELQAGARELAAFQTESKQSLEKLENEIRNVRTDLAQSETNLLNAQKRYTEVHESFSYKLGYDFIHAIIRPGKNTLMFPYNVVRNLKNAYSGKKAPPPEVNPPEVASVPSTNEVTTEAIVEVSDERAVDLKVACIFDEFTTQGYEDECNLFPVPLDGWLDAVTATKPDLLFVESAWQGNAGQWQYKIGKYAGQDGSELKGLIQWCNEHDIPTVFWNKEDPVHYDKFIDSAKQFDVIFTTDEGMVPRYQEAAGHEQVFPLQFSAQPKLHNPVKTMQMEDKVCFAGSYYVNLHETRRVEMNAILDIAKAYGLVIYDRNYERNQQAETEFSFPQRFRENIAGYLKYDEMDRAYKGYKYCLNVNSIKDSRTMFSRRVFESLACGSPVLSTWSKGIEATFGQLILMTGSEITADEILSKLHQDKDEYAQLSVKGIREVYSRHLYSHRFTTILDKAGIAFKPGSEKSVTMICMAQSASDVEQAISQFYRQEFENKKLLLLLDFDQNIETILNNNQQQDNKIDMIHLNSAQTLLYSMDELIDTAYVSLLSTENFYGQFFLTDLVHATIYTDAQVVGKASYYRLQNDKIELLEGTEYSFTDSLENFSAIVDSTVFNGQLLEECMDYITGRQNIVDFSDDKLTCFSTNRFGFVESANAAVWENSVDLVNQVDV